jgi:Cdc6-like AAA superfamily ATPase
LSGQVICYEHTEGCLHKPFCCYHNGMNHDQRIQYQVKLSDAFRPGAPIDSTTLFCGRTAQVDAVVNGVFQPGQHVIMFGERGVGKTSLCKTLVDILKNSGVTPLSSGTINCDGTDDFSSLWHKVFRELQVVIRLEKPGFGNSTEEQAINLDNLLPEKVAPDDVRVAITRALAESTNRKRMLIVLDEVDRIKKRNVTTLLADTIKNLSDHLVPATIILVGVADAVDQLIAEHKSVERSIIQVSMPRMSPVELEEIIDKGFQKAGVEINDDAKKQIVGLSQGLPHFTHLLSLESALLAINSGKTKVMRSDVDTAIKTAVSKPHSLLSCYEKAISSPQSHNLFEEVLIACALAKKDELGWFASSNVVEPLSDLMSNGKQYSVPYFSRHLNEFSQEKRGAILQKSGTTHQHKYRFVNPLLEPYIIMRALSSGLLTDEKLAAYF